MSPTTRHRHADTSRLRRLAQQSTYHADQYAGSNLLYQGLNGRFIHQQTNEFVKPGRASFAVQVSHREASALVKHWVLTDAERAALVTAGILAAD